MAATDGVAHGTSSGIVGAGWHAVRVEGRSAETVIRWLEVRPVRAAG